MWKSEKLILDLYPYPSQHQNLATSTSLPMLSMFGRHLWTRLWVILLYQFFLITFYRWCYIFYINSRWNVIVHFSVYFCFSFLCFVFFHVYFTFVNFYGRQYDELAILDHDAKMQKCDFLKN